MSHKKQIQTNKRDYLPINPNSKNGAIVMLIGILGTAVALGIKSLR